MALAAVGYSLASARAEVLAVEGSDPAAAWRRAERSWRRLPDMQFVAVLSGISAREIATIQDVDSLPTGVGPKDVGAHAEPPELHRGPLARYMVMGVSARTAETVAMEVNAASALAAMARVQFAGLGHPRVHLVAALGGPMPAVEFTLETLPGRRGG